MIIIQRPEGNTATSSYLYNVILRRKEWTKVTLMVDEDDKMIEQLTRKGIKFFKMDGNVQITKQVTNDKDILVDLVKAIEFYDSLLNGLLTDEQMVKVAEREGELDQAIKAKDNAKEVIDND